VSPTLDIADARIAVVDPDTPPVILQDIVAHHPTLWSQVAAHQNTSPQVLAWLQRVGDDAVLNALASRETSMPFDRFTEIGEPLGTEASPPYSEPYTASYTPPMAPPATMPTAPEPAMQQTRMMPPVQVNIPGDVPVVGAEETERLPSSSPSVPKPDIGTIPPVAAAPVTDTGTIPPVAAAPVTDTGSVPPVAAAPLTNTGSFAPIPPPLANSCPIPPVPPLLTDTGSVPSIPTSTGPVPKVADATRLTDTGSFFTTNTGSYPAPPAPAAAVTPPTPVTTFYLAPGALATPPPPPPTSTISTMIGIDEDDIDEDEPHQPKYSDDPESRWYTTDQIGKPSAPGSRNGVVVLVVMLVMAILGGSGWLVGTYAVAIRPSVVPPVATSTTPVETPSETPSETPGASPATPTTTATEATSVKPPTVGLPWVSDVNPASFVINVSVTNPDELMYDVCIFNMGVTMVCYYQQKPTFRTYRYTVDGDYLDYPMDPTVMVTWK